jgi:hypothetical protein
MTTPRSIFAALAMSTMMTFAGYAQTPEAPKAPTATEAPKALQPPAAPVAGGHLAPYGPTAVHLIPLKDATSPTEQNEILTTIRNLIDPRARITLAPSQNTILIEGPDDQIAIAQKIVSALDRSRPAYRITYALIDFDGTKRIGDQHYSMVVVSGQRSVLKQGNKVPIITAADFKNPGNSQGQVTYIDVGINIDVTIDEAANGLRLKTKVEQSSVIDERAAGSASVQDPVLRQSVFEGSGILVPGKPTTIGTLDISGTTRRLEIQAVAEQIAQ